MCIYLYLCKTLSAQCLARSREEVLSGPWLTQCPRKRARRRALALTALLACLGSTPVFHRVLVAQL